MAIITRFPPSPTGNLHIGGARTALFNFLFTRHHGGKIYLRLENTDETRSKPEYEKNILESLEWLGLSFDPVGDKPFWRQNERKEIYRSYLKKLVESGTAYVSKEAPTTPHFLPRAEGEGSRRAEVIRFKNPDKRIVFNDLIRGAISFDTAELGDMVIAKSLEEPLYHLAVVIDDHEMGITHVIRGEDHISNTPRQMLLQEALGFTRPEYAHIPLILAPDRSKLSKRHGAVSVTEYRDRGYFPQALVNYLALLGWNPGTEQEIFSLDELVKLFDLSKVQKGSAIFNEEKLRSINRAYLKKAGRIGEEVFHPILVKLPPVDSKIQFQIRAGALADMLYERIFTLGDVKSDFEKGEFDYLTHTPVYPKELLKWQKATSEPAPHLEKTVALLDSIAPDTFTASAVKDALMPYAEAEGKGNVLWPLRVALSGREKSPDPFTLAAILGKKETHHRLTHAISMLS